MGFNSGFKWDNKMHGTCIKMLENNCNIRLSRTIRMEEDKKKKRLKMTE
jgi:hypothetical protein